MGNCDFIGNSIEHIMLVGTEGSGNNLFLSQNLRKNISLVFKVQETNSLKF